MYFLHSYQSPSTAPGPLHALSHYTSKYVIAKIKLNSKPNTKLLILFQVLASITTYALCQLCSINRAIYYPIKLGRALLAIPLEVQAVSTLLGLELPSQVYILEMELKHHFVSRVYKQRRE